MYKYSKRKSIGIAALLLLIAAIVPLTAQDAADEYEAEPPFVSELAQSLSNRGWTAERIDELVEAARSLEWSGVSTDTAETAAFALHLGMGDEDSGLVQAQTALELALAAMELEELGYEEQTVARAALNGVREMLSDINEWKQNGQEENLGLLIRNQVQEKVTARVKQKEQVREKRQGDALGRGPGGSLPGENRPSIPDDTPWSP